MTKKTDRHIDSIGKDMPYTVPEGFFEAQQELLEKEFTNMLKKRRKRAVVLAVSSVLAVAACLAAFFIPFTTTTSEESAPPESPSALAMAASSHTDSAVESSHRVVAREERHSDIKCSVSDMKAKMTTTNTVKQYSATTKREASIRTADETEDDGEEEMNDDVYLISLQYE